MGKQHALAGVIGQRETQVITAVVDQVKATNDMEGMKLLPAKDVPAAILLHQKVSSFGGKTGERAKDAPGGSVGGRSRETRFFEPGSYQESIRFNERDILMYSKLGSWGERGVTGLNGDQLSEMEMAAQKLRGRLENRMSQLNFDAIFKGVYEYQGKVFDFGVPNANKIQATTDWTVSTTAKPFSDLWRLQSQNPVLRKYKFKAIKMNPKTETDMMLSQEARDALKNFNLVSADVNKIAQLLVPGLAPIVVVRDSYQEENYDNEGAVTLSDASFFLPDDKVLFEPDFGKQIFQSYGEFQIAENLNAPEATLEKPAKGIYVFVDEEGLKKKKNPYVEIVAGMNAAPNLMRSDDVIIISTKFPA